MKNIEAVKAYQALDRLKDSPMDIKTCFKLLNIKKKLQIIYETYIEMEYKMIEKYHLQDHMEGNQIHFDLDEAGQELAREYRKEHMELEEMEADIPAFNRVAIPDNMQITIEDLMALEPIIIIPEMEEISDG